MGLFVGLFVLTTVAVAAAAGGRELRAEDAGSALEIAARVAEYADARLRAAAAAQPLPEPPELLADQRLLQIILGATLVSQAMMLGVVGIATRQDFRGLVRVLGLDRYRPHYVIRPALAVFCAYIGVAVYALAIDATGIGWLQPQSTVPTEITRASGTLAIAAVVILVGAPLSEELFFRGFMFAGLVRYGFWPAAMGSAFFFTAFHFDPGSMIPFTAVGVLMAGLFHGRGTLWDSMIFHFLFNATSFVVLLSEY